MKKINISIAVKDSDEFQADPTTIKANFALKAQQLMKSLMPTAKPKITVTIDDGSEPEPEN